MAPTKFDSPAGGLLKELDELVDQSIDSMSPSQLMKFRRDRRRIMESVTGRDSGSRAPHENAAQER